MAAMRAAILPGLSSPAHAQASADAGGILAVALFHGLECILFLALAAAGRRCRAFVQRWGRRDRLGGWSSPRLQGRGSLGRCPVAWFGGLQTQWQAKGQQQEDNKSVIPA